MTRKSIITVIILLFTVTVNLRGEEYTFSLFSELCFKNKGNIFFSPAFFTKGLGSFLEISSQNAKKSITAKSGKISPFELKREHIFFSNVLIIPSSLKINSSVSSKIEKWQTEIKQYNTKESGIISSLFLPFCITDIFGEIEEKPLKFNTSDGIKNIKAIQFNGFFKMYQTPFFQVLFLPVEDKNISIMLVLSKGSKPIEEICSSLNKDILKEWERLSGLAEGYILLPYFNKEGKTRIDTEFKKEGLSFYEQRVKLSMSCTDKRFGFAFNDPRTFTPHEFFNFITERPFLLIVKDNLSGEIILLGLIREP